MNFLRKAADKFDEVEEGMKKLEVKAKQATGRDVEVDGEKISEDDFDGKVQKTIPAVVRMISGCHDTQTSADVSNTASFELPVETGPGGAGGAATNSLLAAIERNGSEDLTWVELLEAMRKILDEKGYSQIPQLSASRKLDVAAEKFNLINPDESSGNKRKALLVGINYVGQKGELAGCHNDVISMKRFLEKQGFQEFRVLLDDGEAENPTADNIMKGFDWLTEGNSTGDSLFFHYSGHGGYVADDSGDEKDGRDETIVPVDFQSTGQIRDDLIFKELVLPVDEGITLSCLMDCCHSGTVLDLPYMIKASEHLDSSSQMEANPGFSFKKLFTLAVKIYEMKKGGASNTDMAKAAGKDILPMFAGSNKNSGGLGNLMSFAASMAGGSGGSSGGKLPSLPF
ncbi:Metacaspase-1 [Hondaea fermentalgiana]|uniref:Metacaspase-1 n=1 Tax=Hondaea fermentalgiana TaxID=2315210 RepID=A0A2R5G0J8_9STRA|nr:Metacaspase-1 [Hondaea fermentalgiana]|eukprot:GBG24542.1 Metacaspase-1 [Hondaea fermentalgiana]